MIRSLVIALFLVLAVPVMALAGAGHEADFVMTMKMDPAMFGGMPGAEDADQTMEFGGKMYWNSDAMRLDMDMSQMGIEMVTTTIVDYKNMITYTLNSADKTAIKMDLNESRDEMEAMGMPPMEPDQLFGNWNETKEMFEGIEGISLNELGTETIDGIKCQKIDLEADMKKLMGATEEEPMDDEMMAMFGDYSGTFWVSEELNMPIKMNMNVMGMEMVWSLQNVTEWSGDNAMLSVPEDYTVLTMEEMMEGMMSEMEVGAE